MQFDNEYYQQPHQVAYFALRNGQHAYKYGQRVAKTEEDKKKKKTKTLFLREIK